MATDQENREGNLKHLGFFRVAAIRALPCVSTLYGQAKENSGSPWVIITVVVSRIGSRPGPEPVGMKKPNARVLLPQLSLFSFVVLPGLSVPAQRRSGGGWTGGGDDSGGDSGYVGKLPLPPSLSASSPPSHAASPSFDNTPCRMFSSSPSLLKLPPHPVRLPFTISPIAPLDFPSLCHFTFYPNPPSFVVHWACPVDLEFEARGFEEFGERAIGSRLPNLGVLGKAECLSLELTHSWMSVLPLQQMDGSILFWATTGVVSQL
ncbi:hypothetical protein EJ110_NYTH09854 [Nymphaea thermarum]|nr:hypothetical protein EJ110_NYTH09854 [Nymphaea thermarum]